MNIVICGQTPPPYGGQNLNTARVIELLKSLDVGDVRHLRTEFTSETKHFRKFQLRKITELFRVVYRLAKLRLKGPIDLLVFSTGGPHTLPILRDLVLVPLFYLSSRHSWVRLDAGGIAEWLKDCNSLLGGALKLVYRLVSGAIINIDWGRVDTSALGIERVVVIPPVIESSAIKEEGSFPVSEVNPMRILSVGHVCEVKGILKLVEAFGKLVENHPSVMLRIVGEYAEDTIEGKILELIERYGLEGRVEMLGLLVDESLSEEYRQADIFVFPSLALESFGMVLGEAMMHGLPVVAYDLRGNADVLKDNFGGALAEFNPSDGGHSLRDALEKVIADQGLWPEWSEMNRRNYLDHYSEQAVSSLWRSFIRSIESRSIERRSIESRKSS